MSQCSDVPGNSSTELFEPNEDEDWKKYKSLSQRLILHPTSKCLRLLPIHPFRRGIRKKGPGPARPH